MTPIIRYWSFAAAVLLLLAIAPIKAKQLGVFPGFGQPPRIFSASAISPYSLLAGGIGAENNPPADDLPLFVFDSAALEAQAAIIWDVDAGSSLFEKIADDVRPLASLTKLMTAFAADRIFAVQSENERVVSIMPEAIAEEGDDGFRAGEQFYFNDLRDVMLVKSSNDAALAIAARAESLLPPSSEAPGAQRFVNEMNRYASEWGISSMYFLNPTGLDITSERAGAYGTARDVARLFSRILGESPAILFATQAPEITVMAVGGDTHRLPSSALPVLSIPGLIGVKTGFTDLALGNVVLGWSTGGRHFVVAVLGSSADGRFSDALTLYNATMDFLAIGR